MTDGANQARVTINPKRSQCVIQGRSTVECIICKPWSKCSFEVIKDLPKPFGKPQTMLCLYFGEETSKSILKAYNYWLFCE